MRRSFWARAACAATPCFMFLPSLAAYGQAASGAYAGQAYINPTYRSAAYPPAAAAGSQYPAAAVATPMPTAPTANAYPGPSAADYPPPIYTAQADPQTAPQGVTPPPHMSDPPHPPLAVPGHAAQDAAASYGYPPAAGCETNPWSGYGCEHQAYGASGYASGPAGCDASSAYCGPTMTCSPPIVWEVYGGALLMFRDDENHYFYSYDSAIESDQYLDARNAYEEFLPGFEAGFRRFNCCTCTGWEGLYWGLFPGDGSSMVYSTDVTGNLDPILDFSQLDYNGNSADNYTNAAAAHRLQRYTEIHNAELNRLWGMPGCGACSPWSVTTLAGFRYFRVKDYLEFASDVDDTMFTGEVDELYYSIDTENDLYGGQIGAQVERRTAGRFSFNGGVKAGVFCNSASATSWIGGAAGTAIVNNGPNDNREWLISADKEDVAFLGEVKAGLAYQLSERWRLLSDYRVIGVSGLALPTNQIYSDLRGVNDVELLKTNGSLFLHGVFVGAERVF